MMACITRLSLVAAIAISTLPLASQAATIVKVADEFGTIQASGPRAATGGNRFWNIDGNSTGFGATGTLRFYMTGVKSQLDTMFPTGWVVDNVSIVLEHSDAAFTTAGVVDVLHFDNDSLAITNGANTGDASPGEFGSLPVSPLQFSAGTPITKTTGGSFGTVTAVDRYNFSAEGTGDLDVLGLASGVVDSTGAIDANPTYGLDFPELAGGENVLATLNAERATASSNLNVPVLAADIMSGNDPVSLLFAPGTTGLVATYKGNPFSGTNPPRMYIEAHAVPEPATVALLFLGAFGSLGVASRRR